MLATIGFSRISLVAIDVAGLGRITSQAERERSHRSPKPFPPFAGNRIVADFSINAQLSFNLTRNRFRVVIMQTAPSDVTEIADGDDNASDNLPR